MPDERGPEADHPDTSPVDVEAIRQLLDLMSEHGLAELEIERDDVAIRLRKAGAEPGPAFMPAMPAAMAQPPAAAPGPQAGPGGEAAAREEEELPAIVSPMVGTFYEASSPEADAYVAVGDHVDEDTVVCMIEAMKVFNEIRAEMSGTVEKILVANAEAVEFGQPMFRVRPD